MNPQDEIKLYKTNYTAWCEYMAPRIKAIVATVSQEEKERIWAACSLGLRSAIKKLYEKEKAA